MTVRHVFPPKGAHEETLGCPCWPTVVDLPTGTRVIHHEPDGTPGEPIPLDPWRANRNTEGGRQWLRTRT